MTLLSVNGFPLHFLVIGETQRDSSLFPGPFLRVRAAIPPSEVSQSMAERIPRSVAPQMLMCRQVAIPKEKRKEEEKAQCSQDDSCLLSLPEKNCYILFFLLDTAMTFLLIYNTLLWLKRLVTHDSQAQFFGDATCC